MSDVFQTLRQWSATASSNKPADTDVIGSGLADNIRVIQSTIRSYLASQSATVVPLAGVADLSTATGLWVPISGNSTVSGLGTEPAGIWYKCVLTGAPPILNNTAMALPGAATIQGAVGDTFIADSQGGGLWKISSYTRQGGSPAVAVRGHVSGLTMSAAGSTVAASVSAGQATDSTNTDWISLASSITKTTAAWSAGSGNGGLDNGSIANSTWYHAHVIKRTDTGAVDVLFSTSATSPTMPSNYTLSRRIGAMRTDGSGNWTAFVQTGDDFYWSTPPAADLNGTPADTNAHLLTCTITTGVKVKGYFNLSTQDNGATGAQAVYLSDPNCADVAPSINATPLSSLGYSGTAGNNHVGSADCWTNTSGQIRYRATFASGTVRIVVLGWMDRRGKDA